MENSEKRKEMKSNHVIDSKQTVILYHGSKSGIHGSIAPVSRKQCDFGKGFYMGGK